MYRITIPLLNAGFSIAGAPQLRVGLDEELSVPDDSYLIKYFDYMQKYLRCDQLVPHVTSLFQM